LNINKIILCALASFREIKVFRLASLIFLHIKGITFHSCQAKDKFSGGTKKTGDNWGSNTRNNLQPSMG